VREALNGAPRLGVIDRVAAQLGAMDADQELSVFDAAAVEVAQIV
jgi:hypothetical protein